MDKKRANPDLPYLNPRTKQKLIAIADTYARGHKENLLTYLERGEITFDEMPLLDNDPEIKAWLMQQYDKWLHYPNPQEQSDWEEILRLLPSDMDSPSNDMNTLKAMLEQYVNDYGDSMPEGNHLDMAKEHIERISKKQEKVAWDKVDILDYESLISYYNRNKETPYFKEVDDCLWAIVYTDPVDINLIRRFMQDIPNSSHYAQAESIEKGFSDWDKAKGGRDLKMVYQYLKDHPSGTFSSEARELFGTLKQEYLENFKRDMAVKSIHDYDNEIRSGIFSQSDFIEAGIATAKSIEKLRELANNPFITIVEYPTEITCPSNHTDVYFFGIPSTGKTCIMMGLLNSTLLNWNAVKYGGKAGLQLQDLCDHGIPPGRTEDKQVIVINGTIPDEASRDIKHPVNLIDMSGEEFAYKISENPEAKVSFADMGKGIPEMLSNDNDKIFFITIDPVFEYAKFRKLEEDGEYKERRVSQKQTLQRFMSILEDRQNENIMRKVKAIHIITTKSDSLSNDRDERAEIAKAIVNEKYIHSINKLIPLCHPQKFDINPASGNEPLLFDFSLGKFYMGGIFEYDSTDSDKIIRVIAEISSGQRVHKTKWEKLTDWFNS